MSDTTMRFKCELGSRTENSELTLEVNDAIDSSGGPFGISAREVMRALTDNPDVDRIVVRIHSSGGDLFDALAIYHRLVSHSAPVTVMIDGLAASAASVIAMAGDAVEMAETGWIMVHEPATIAVGMARDFEKVADLLNRNTDILAGIYASKSGAGVETAREWVSNETWFAADEAVEVGLADTVVAGSRVAASVAPGRFENTPRQVQAIEPSRRGAGKDPNNTIAKEPLMATPTAAEIREVCIGADSEFVLSQLEKQATIQDALKDWAATIAARLENRDEQIELIKSENTTAVENLKAEHAKTVEAKDGEIEQIKTHLAQVRAGVEGDGPAADVSDGNEPEKRGLRNAVRISGQINRN